MFAKTQIAFISIVALSLLGGAFSTADASDASTTLQNVALATNRPVAAAPTSQPGCGRCEPREVQRVVHFKGSGAMVRTVKEMDCGGCKSALANLLTRGKFEHTCSLLPDPTGDCH